MPTGCPWLAGARGCLPAGLVYALAGNASMRQVLAAAAVPQRLRLLSEGVHLFGVLKAFGDLVGFLQPHCAVIFWGMPGV